MEKVLLNLGFQVIRQKGSDGLFRSSILLVPKLALSKRRVYVYKKFRIMLISRLGISSPFFPYRLWWRRGWWRGDPFATPSAFLERDPTIRNHR
jgi:hypothetical protein